MPKTPDFHYHRQLLPIEDNYNYIFNTLIKNNIINPDIFEKIKNEISHSMFIAKIAASIEHLAYKKMLTQEYVFKIFAEPINAYAQTIWLCKLKKHGLLTAEYTDLANSKFINERDLVILKKCSLLTQRNLKALENLPRDANPLDRTLLGRIIDTLVVLRKKQLATQENFDLLIKYCKNVNQVETIKLLSSEQLLSQQTFYLALWSNARLEKSFFDLLGEFRLDNIETLTKILEIGCTSNSIYLLLDALKEAKQLNIQTINQLHQWKEPFAPSTVTNVINELTRRRLYESAMLPEILSNYNSYWNYLRTLPYQANSDIVEKNLAFFLKHSELAKDIPALSLAYTQLHRASLDTTETRLSLAKRPIDSFHLAKILRVTKDLGTANQQAILGIPSQYLPVVNYVLEKLSECSLLNQTNFDKTLAVIQDIDKLSQAFNETPFTQKTFDAAITKIEDYQRSLLILMAAKKGTLEKGSSNAFFRFFGHTKDENDNQVTPNHPLGEANIVKHIAALVRK